MPLLEELTTREAAEGFDDVDLAVLPTGSTEQHGPALPMGTDSMAAEAVARDVADREDVVVLPTIPVGVSDHHRQFHGTLWVPPETFEQYVRDTVVSLTGHGIRKSIVVNGHGGNTGPLDRVFRRLHREEKAFALPWSWWEGVGAVPAETIDDDVRVPGHAGAFETSMIYEVREELVREGLLETAEKGESTPPRWEDEVAPSGVDIVDRTATGVVGQPTKASREAGERLIEASQEELDTLVDWLATQPFEDLLPHEHE